MSTQTHTQRRMRTETRAKDSEFNLVFQLIAYGVIIVLSLMCLLPFLLILSGSFTSNESIVRDGYHLFPTHFSGRLQNGIQIPDPGTESLRGYGVHDSCWHDTWPVFYHDGGICASAQRFQIPEYIILFIYFTTLFGGGLVPWYIMLANYFNLTDTYTVLIFPG